MLWKQHYREASFAASDQSISSPVRFVVLVVLAFLIAAGVPALSQRTVLWAAEAGNGAMAAEAGSVARDASDNEANAVAMDGGAGSVATTNGTMASKPAAETSIVREHTYPKGESDPEPPTQHLSIDGVRYELIAVETMDAESKPEESVFTHGYSVQCAPGDLDATLDSAPEKWSIDEHGYKGSIPRTSLNSEPHYATRQYQADVVQTFSGLPSNDVSQIPMSASFTLDTGNTQTLDCAGISWSVEETDDRGVPCSYCATVTYRGVDQMQVVDFYQVTAEYQGTVSGPKKPLSKVVATYGMVETVDLSDRIPNAEAFTVPIWAFALGGGTAATACILLIVPIWRRKRCTVAIQELGFAPPVDSDSFDDSLIKLTRVRIRKASDACYVDIPSRLSLEGCAAVVLQFGKAFSDGRPLMVTRGPQTVYEGPSLSTIRIPL